MPILTHHTNTCQICIFWKKECTSTYLSSAQCNNVFDNVLWKLFSSSSVPPAQLIASISSSHFVFISMTRLKRKWWTNRHSEWWYSPYLFCQNVSDECRLTVSVSIFLLFICVGTGEMYFRINYLTFSSSSSETAHSRLHLGLEKLRIYLLTTWLLK